MVSLLQRLTFPDAGMPAQRKVSKRLRPGVRRLAKAPRSLATVSIRGHRLRSASLRPPLDVCGFAARRYAPNPLMNTYARPAEGAKDQKQIKIKNRSTSTARSTASRASSLPQLDRVHPKEIGWLSGRLRWQASSHNGSAYSPCFPPLNRPSVSSPESF
jgi:hypothetical protein